jgi:LacI family transcriptional regulator
MVQKNSWLILDKNLIKHENSQDNGGFRATVELLALPTPPAAIFAADSQMTMGIMKALYSKNMCCPKDMAIIGFDNFEWVICFSLVFHTGRSR